MPGAARQNSGAARHAALFLTPIGTCGLAWTASGICALQLPEADEGATRGRLLARCSGASEAAPPPPIAAAIEAIQGQLATGRGDLGAIPVDYAGQPPFFVRVYDRVRAIAAGTTITYGAVAADLGESGAARAVGEAMARNPVPLIVPCHRVVGSPIGGRPSPPVGFSAHGGLDLKRRLLLLEGAAPGGQGLLL